MKERTRLISLILSFVMLAGCILPGLTLRVEATLTTSVYKTKYQEFINNEQWRPGTWWGDEKTPNLSHWQSWGCCAYVYDFAAYVYGNYSGLAYSSEFTPFTDPAQIKTGDIVHYYYDYWDNQSGSWKQSQHWFVVLERWGDTLYTAEGNFDHGIRVTDAAYYIADGTLKNRNNNTTYYGFDCYHYNGFIDDQLAQAYIAQCTPYKTYGTILVTKDGANINDRPCSAKTDAGIVTKIDAALNSEYTVTKVYKNTENNYWYEVMLSTYERGYIYSGNCTFTGNQLYADVVLVNTNIPAQQPLNASFRLGGNIYAPFSQLDATTVSMYNTANGKELASQKLVTSDLSEFEYSVAFLEPTTVRCEVYASVSYFDVASERYINSIKCVHTGQIQFSCTEHAFGDWTVTKTATCTAEGSRSRTCSICTETVTESIPVIEHSWQVTDYSGITCTNPAYENSRCVHCRQTKSERGEVTWSDWVEVCPEKTAPDRIETKKQYRFRDMGGDWTVTENGTLDYVSEWPAGFPTTADLYHAYNKTPLQDSETETRRVRVTSQENKNWLYYHWCRGSYTAGPINRRISNVYTDQYPCFHGFVSAHWVGFDASANAWNYSEPACCRDTYWYFQIPVYTQTYTVEERSAASGEWSSWSEWSDTAVSPSDTRQVETREVYRYITSGLADHSWDEGEIVKAPTVDAEGQLVTTCTVCGTKYTEVLPKLPAEECPHISVQIVNKKDATCTEEGYTGDEICAVCSETLSTGESIPAAGHRWDDGVVTAPTCTEKGYTTYTCACGDSYQGNETPAADHSFGDWYETKAPTLEAKGEERRDCANCEEFEVREVEKLDGIQTFRTSGDLTMAPLSQREIAEKFAEIPDISSIFVQEPSVTAPYATGKLSDSMLNNALYLLNYFRYTAKLPQVRLSDELINKAQHGAVLMAANDMMTHYPPQPADMDDDFYQMGYSSTSSSNISSNFGYPAQSSLQVGLQGCLWDSDPSNISRLGHRRWLLNPTLYNVGFGHAQAPSGWNYSTTQVFDRSGETVDFDFVAFPASGNFPTNLFNNTVPWSVVLNPIRFEIPKKDQLTITITRQSDGKKWVLDSSAAEPTTSVEACLSVETSGCGIFNCIIFTPGSRNLDSCMGKFTVEITGLQTRDGNEAELLYEVNFFDINAAEEDPHSCTYTAVVTPSTCTEPGYTTYTCTCGDSYRGNETPANGHSFGKWTLTRQPACTEKGTETRTCACGETETREVEAKGHSEVVDAAKEATCTETGLTEGKRCSVCNDILVEQEVIPVKDHSWNDGEVTKEPTEIAKGEKTFTCTICGEKKMEELPTLEHVHKHESVVTAPTCTQPGYTTYTCACGDTYRGNEVPVTEHTYGDWVTVSEAGCTTTGMEIRSCICGEGETREIPALDHHYVNGACIRCDTKDPDYEVPTEPTEPEPTEPEPTEPEPTEPEPTEPEPTEPEPTEPEPTEPEPTEPEPTEPEPTEPEPTEPEPTEPEPTDPIEPEEIKLTRIAGTNRIKTAIASADKLKVVLGVDKFRTIVVANAMNFPDALSGSYLAAATKAPILLYADGQTLVTNYIKENLVSDGKVYILGGTGSVSENIVSVLEGIDCQRVSGSGRYGTSLEIIKTADAILGTKPGKILICDGTGFADSLSASATGLPILLVNGKGDSLRDDQKAYLESVRGAELYAIGGVNTIVPAMMDALSAYDADGVERVAGNGRELTSVAVANAFFPGAKAVALASSLSFPDGLSGGPVAYAMNMPLLLTREGKEVVAENYVNSKSIAEGYIIGGASAVSDESAKNIFAK